MRSKLLIGVIALTVAGAAAAAPEEQANTTRWDGFVLRDGLRSPIAVGLSSSAGKWDGQLSAGDNAVALEDVRVTATHVHFQAPGEGVFDGEVVGAEIAGQISGPSSGSFVLSREDAGDYSPYFLGP